MKPLVIYHGPNCADGFTAAWVAWRHFRGEADFVPANYGEPPPDVAGRDVYVLDFSYKRPVTDALAAEAATLVVCDHHKTAQAELAHLPCCNSANINTISRGGGDTFCVFDMGKSGAMLAWEFFNPGEEPPALVRYVQDRDLWKWELPFSREVSAWLTTQPREFADWEAIAGWLNGPYLAKGYKVGEVTVPDEWAAEDGLEYAVEHGRTVLKCQALQVDAICRHAREVDIDGHKVLAANTPLLQSEVAGKLAAGRAFGAAYFDRADGKRQWSLRSREGGVDVSEIAKKRGGGGHFAAAGFEE